MGRLFEQIRAAVENDRFFVAWHADERWEERGITAWHLVAGLAEAELVRERPQEQTKPLGGSSANPRGRNGGRSDLVLVK